MSKLTKIDELLLPEHNALTYDDECYFLLEFTAGEGYEYGNTNELIFNFKKKPKFKEEYSWNYKIRDTKRIAQMICSAIKFNMLKNDYWLLVPPSKTPDHPDFDPRLNDLITQIEAISGRKIDILNIISQIRSTEADHSGTAPRKTIQELIDNYQVTPSQQLVSPSIIFIFDDMITNGNHFKAVQQLITPLYPDAKIVGLFIARRIHLDLFK